MNKDIASTSGLVEEIMGGAKEIKVLEETLKNVRQELKAASEVTDKLLDNMVICKVTLAIANGRVSKDEYLLAEQVLETSKEELFERLHTKTTLQAYEKELSEVLRRVEASRNVEENMKHVESFMNSRRGKSSTLALPPTVKYELEDLNKKSKHLVHSVGALIDLKTGKI